MRASDHIVREAEHARLVGYQQGDPMPLGESDPVPGCSCALCTLLAWRKGRENGAAIVDVTRHQVLPALAERRPTDRLALALHLRAEWARAAMVELPPAALLVALAADMPGATKGPARDPDPGRKRQLEDARAVSILAVARELGIELRKAGRSWRGPCPIHGGEGPNFSVDPAKGLFKCFVCGERGDGIALYEAVTGADFLTTVRELARLAGVAA